MVQVTSETIVPADAEMNSLLNKTYIETLKMMERNGAALWALVSALLGLPYDLDAPTSYADKPNFSPSAAKGSDVPDSAAGSTDAPSSTAGGTAAPDTSEGRLGSGSAAEGSGAPDSAAGSADSSSSTAGSTDASASASGPAETADSQADDEELLQFVDPAEEGKPWGFVTGDEVRRIVQALADKEYLDWRDGELEELRIKGLQDFL